MSTVFNCETLKNTRLYVWLRGAETSRLEFGELAVLAIVYIASFFLLIYSYHGTGKPFLEYTVWEIGAPAHWSLPQMWRVRSADLPAQFPPQKPKGRPGQRAHRIHQISRTLSGGRSISGPGASFAAVSQAAGTVGFGLDWRCIVLLINSDQQAA